MQFPNLDLSPRASAALDQLATAIDEGDIPLADAITAARILQRIDSDPQAVIDLWTPLPGEHPLENTLAERVEADTTIFIVVWEVRPDLPAYVHDIGWEQREQR